mgnify:CR=1 FL=1
MKYVITISLFLIHFDTYSQIINDTIFINFNEKVDFIKVSKKGKKYIILKNVLYEDELSDYERRIKKIDKDSLLPPTIRYPTKPNKFYNFFLTDSYFKDCDGFLNLNYNDIDFYDRSNIKSLMPYKKLILIVKKKENGYLCYPVSFFKNVKE